MKQVVDGITRSQCEAPRGRCWHLVLWGLHLIEKSPKHLSLPSRNERAICSWIWSWDSFKGYRCRPAGLRNTFPALTKLTVMGRLTEELPGRGPAWPGSGCDQGKRALEGQEDVAEGERSHGPGQRKQNSSIGVPRYLGVTPPLQ